MNIREFVITHTQRGECQCGRCIDRGTAPDPEGHTVDMIFFKVAAQNEPKRDDYERLTREWEGDFAAIDLFDGREHGFIELGGWIGDQGLALQYMALGVLLGVFKLYTPHTVFGLEASDDLVMRLAGAGYITIKYG